MTADRPEPGEVVWPDWRGDVVAALRRLSTISLADITVHPDLEDVVHWLVDDTWWDHHPPADDVGRLLRDDDEAAAVDAVLHPLLSLLDAIGPSAQDDDYLRHPEWPRVAEAAASAVHVLTGDESREHR